MDKPFYPHPGIGSISALAKTLDVHRDLLIDIAQKADTSYTSFFIPKKNNGGDREVLEPKHELKKLQKKINSRILEKVKYPLYLHGGIRDIENSRDYVNNSALHARPAVLVAVDIKNFYPNIHRCHVLAVFQHFLGFAPDVAEILTRLTTFESRVPQGGCCSSYLANLIFFADEYKLVQKLKHNGWCYSRLLDDITLSSTKHIDDHVTPIKLIAGMCKKYSLKLNNKKTEVSHRIQGIAKLEVTGVWIAHGVPKLKKEERRYIRLLVYVCEKKYSSDPYDEKYHDFWNMVSGKVAKATRLAHPEAVSYRERLKRVLPLYDEAKRSAIIREVKALTYKKIASKTRIGFIKRINRAHYSINILSRTDSYLAKKLRTDLKMAHVVPTIEDFWES